MAISDDDFLNAKPEIASVNDQEFMNAKPTVTAAPSVDASDPVNQAVFQQSGANKVLNAAQGNWFTRPFKAAEIAVENSYDGLTEGSLDDLQKAGLLMDYKKQQSEFRQTVNGAILMPSAAAADVAKLAGDTVMSTINAAASGAVALGEGFLGEASGAVGGARMSPETTAQEAQVDTNALYLMGGMSSELAPVASQGPTLREALSIPKQGKSIAAEAEIPSISSPIIKAPIKSPLIDEASGNLNLKYIKADDDVQGILARSAQAVADRDGVVISNDITKAKGQELVDQAMSETADGIPPELANRMRGDPTNEAQLYAARLLVKQAGDEVFNLGQIAQKTGDARDYAALEESYDRLMTVNGIRHDISATIGRASQSHQIVIGGEEGAQLITGMSKEDAMRTAMTLPSDQAVAKAVQTMQKPGWSDMAIFHYVSWLLSNPVTHAAYAAAGEVQKVIRQGESALSVGIGAIQRRIGSGLSSEDWNALHTERQSIESRLADADAGRVQIKASESGQMETRLKEIIKKQQGGETRMPEELQGRLYGVGKGYVDGLRAAMKSLKSGGTQMFPGEEAAAQLAQKKAEETALEEGKGADEARKAGNSAYAQSAVKISNPIMERAEFIKNPLFKSLTSGYGRIVGISPTIAGAIHTFQKFAGYTESLYATAYRRAALMGAASDEEMGANIAKLLSNPTEDMMKQAAEDGKYASLVNRPGGLGQNIENVAHTNAWTRFVIPFARIANNLTSQTLLERTPVGFASGEIRARLMGERGAVAQSDAIARMALGTGITTTGAWLTTQGLVNGLGSTDPKARLFNYMIGRPPLTVRIADRNIPLRLFGVPGRIISYGAAVHDVMQGWKEGDDAWDGFGNAIHTIADTALQENALKGLSDFLDAVVGHDKEMSKRYALNAVAAIVVPRGVAQWTRLDDPDLRSTMGSGFTDRLQKTIDAQLPWKSQELLPRVDAYGRDMVRGADYDAAMKDPVTQAELNAHSYPTLVEPRLGKVKLTDQQYYDYQKLAGTLYYQNAAETIKDPNWNTYDTSTQADMLHQAQLQARKDARCHLNVKYPDISKSNAKYCKDLLAGGSSSGGADSDE